MNVLFISLSGASTKVINPSNQGYCAMMMQSKTGVEDFKNRSYFPFLDGIRAISVFMVMSNHLHSTFIFMRRTPGWAGVDVFCVLSGFIITTLLLREERVSGSIRLRAFYLRRLFRIVPVFLSVLLFYVPVAYFGEHGARWGAFTSALPLYLTFLQDFVPHEAPFSFSWTLGIEEKFYLIWPLLALVFIKRLRYRTGLACLFLLVSGTLYVCFESSSDLAFYQARSYAALALGSLLACLLASQAAQSLSQIYASIPSLVPIALILLSLVLVYENRVYILLLDLVVGFCLSYLLLTNTLAGRCLASPIPVWIGKRSYSMYLIHLLILTPIRLALHPTTELSELLVLTIAYAVTAGCAHLIYLAIEQPMRALGKRLETLVSDQSKSPAKLFQPTG